MSASKHFFRCLPRGGGHLGTRNHARELGGAVFAGRTANQRRREPILLVFLNDEMSMGEGGDRSEVGDAKHLPMAGHVRDRTSDALRYGAANAGVDLVEDVKTGRSTVGEIGRASEGHVTARRPKQYDAADAARRRGSAR